MMQTSTARRSNVIRESFSRRAFLKLNTVFLILVCFLMLYPVVYVIACSFSEETAILRGDVKLPAGAATREGLYEGFQLSPALDQLPQYDSLYRTGYVHQSDSDCMRRMGAESEKDGRSAVLYARCVPSRCSFGGGMIPTFLIVKDYRLLNTIWAMILPGAVSTYNMILMRTFFLAIPSSLVEAAELDGCTDFGILFKIVLPLSMASLMTIGMFYAVGHWNSYFNAVIYLSDKELFPLQIILRQVVLMNEIVENAYKHGKQYGGRHQIRYDRSRHATHAVRISLRAEVFCQGRYDWFRKGITKHLTPLGG